MKIAYLITGHLRTGQQNDSLVRRLIGPNPGDVYVHTYAYRNGSAGRWHPDNTGDGQRLTKHEERWIQDTYKPVDLLVEPLTCGADYLPPRHRTMGQRYGVAAAQGMLRDSGKHYDIVFHARFDLFLFDPFAFPAEIHGGTIYGGRNPVQLGFGRDGEVFVFGSPGAMRAVNGEAVPAAYDELAQRVGFCGEELFTHIRKAAGLNYEPVDVPYGLLRSDGISMVNKRGEAA